MDDKLRRVIEKMKEMGEPGLKVGWVICNPNIMTVDSEIHEYEDAKRLIKNHTAEIGWMADRLMPVFWVGEEDDGEYLPSNSLEAD